MTRQQSFSKAENTLLPKFRKMINGAESTEDVKKFFVYCMQDLFNQAFGGRMELQFEDVRLQPEGEPPFALEDRILTRAEVDEIWNTSDLPQIMLRFAEIATHRYRHLAKNPEKTEAKFRM